MLRATPARLKALLEAAPRDVVRIRPAPGKWSIHEIVCHMRDMERDSYQIRYRRILLEDGPTLPHVNGDRLALEHGYPLLELTDVLRDWERLRMENLALLDSVPDESWLRMGTHETDGPLSLAMVLRRHARGNDEAHLRQIADICERQTLLTRLASAPRELRDLLAALDEAALRQRTPEGKWSPLEHACHLRDIEHVFCERFTKAAFSDRPRFWMLDNDIAAERLHYARADVGTVVKEFTRRRKDTLVLLRALPQPVWQRTGIHPTAGETTIAQLVERLLAHDRNHLGRIRQSASAARGPVTPSQGDA
jgi:uncharacterized damage-inducible protein DinB